MLCLAAALVFTGCQMEGERENTGFIPVGEWSSEFDRYTITTETIDYFMEGSEWEGIIFPDTILKGSIERAIDFSDSAGVLVIKITEATYNTHGKYTGVYYRDYSGSAIKLATAIGPEPDFAPLETDTLTEALSLFNAGNSETHVTFWGSGYVN
jgi:catechol 2,3-dioxygenase-like lactoylglutathione lyase family enzyme